MKKTETFSFIECDICFEKINTLVYYVMIIDDISYDLHNSCFESFNNVMTFLNIVVNQGGVEFRAKKINRREDK